MHEERKTKLPEFFSDPVTWIALRDTDTGDWIVCSKHRHATKQEATDAITVLAARQQAREAIDLALHLDVNENQYVELVAAYEALTPR